MPIDRSDKLSRQLPRLPQLLDRKVYKTGQTRGADDDVIYQNRVGRNSTVLIPYDQWTKCRIPSLTENEYEKGFIVLIPPANYFGNASITTELAEQGLEIGLNALLFYQKRIDWNAYPPDSVKWTPATQRTPLLGGQYVARIAGTTSNVDAARINLGFTGSKSKGAGIRVYEYASSEAIKACRLQLEALVWLCRDAEKVAVANGMTMTEVVKRKEGIMAVCQVQNLLQAEQLRLARVIDTENTTICPLCLYELSSQGFFDRVLQAEGRTVHDLTITQLNLFHVEELRFGKLNHRPYNVGWGHHHCNVVAKDSGITETVRWMQEVVDRNATCDYSPIESSKDT